MKGVKLILAIASGTRDWQLLQLLIRASCENGTEAPDLTKEIISLSATYGLDETSADTAERCPACDRDLGYDASGTTKCVGGHEWCKSVFPLPSDH